MVETCLRAEIDGDVLALSMTSAKPHYPALIELLPIGYAIKTFK